MDSKDVKEKIHQFFRNNCLYSGNEDEIGADQSLIDNGYIDSTGIIGLVLFIEQSFKIKVYDQEIIPENFDSINSIFSYVNKKV